MENPNNGQKIRQTILIVEDENSLLEALANKLSRAGYAVMKAKDGAAGLAVALKEHPDLILLDLAMPIMDGMTMLHQLRQDAWGTQAAVIILTNLDPNDERLAKVVVEHPSYYLIKTSHTLEQVLERVGEVLNDPKAGTQV